MGVACHGIDRVVNADARQSQLVTEGGVPFVGILIVNEERSLSVEPDVFHRVGIGFQALCLAQMQVRYVVGCPYRLHLVHDVAAYQSAIVIDHDGTVATLADGADGSLRNTVCVVGVSELVQQLLLHVIGHDALVGNGCPQVLVAVNIDNVRLTLDTHASEHLLHVALEGLCLRMIDTEARTCLNPQVAVQRLLNALDVAVRQRRTVLRVTLVVLEHITVVAVQSGRRSQPDVTLRVFEDTIYLTARQTVLCIQCLEQINSCSCQWHDDGQCQQYSLDSFHSHCHRSYIIQA